MTVLASPLYFQSVSLGSRYSAPSIGFHVRGDAAEVDRPLDDRATQPRPRRRQWPSVSVRIFDKDPGVGRGVVWVVMAEYSRRIAKRFDAIREATMKRRLPYSSDFSPPIHPRRLLSLIFLLFLQVLHSALSFASAIEQ